MAEEKAFNWKKMLKKTKLTRAQEKAIFKAKPQDKQGNFPKNSPSFAELARKYNVPVSEINKAWGNENLRDKWKDEKKVTKDLIKKFEKVERIGNVLQQLRTMKAEYKKQEEKPKTKKEEKPKTKKTLRSTRGGGSIVSQFGSGKRGAEKLRASPFEVNRGGVIKRAKVKR